MNFVLLEFIIRIGFRAAPLDVLVATPVDGSPFQCVVRLNERRIDQQLRRSGGLADADERQRWKRAAWLINFAFKQLHNVGRQWIECGNLTAGTVDKVLGWNWKGIETVLFSLSKLVLYSWTKTLTIIVVVLVTSWHIDDHLR